MLTCKFKKEKSAKFLSHLDVLNHMTRTIKRANLQVEYSQGYNPHMLINLSAPLPLGLESESEYVSIATNVNAKEFMTKFNAVALDGLTISKAFEVTKNPNIMGKSHSAEYSILLNGVGKYKNEIQDILSQSTYEIEFFHKNKYTTAQVRDKIISVEIKKNELVATLMFGNINLRADRLAYNLAKTFDLNTEDLQIIKKKQLVLINSTVVNADDYIMNFNATTENAF